MIINAPEREFDEVAERHIRWLIAKSDVELARAMLGLFRDRDPVVSAKLRAYIRYIDKFWPMLTKQEEYDQVYSEAGRIEATNFVAFDYVPSLDRYKTVATLLAHCPDCSNILDYGCSRGHWSVHLHNMLGRNWSLWDIDALSRREAGKCVNARAKHPEDLTVLESDPLGNRDLHGSFDGILLLEVLEHVLDLRGVLLSCMQLVRPNGLFFISVPAGPMEYTMWVEDPDRRREHIREFLFQDIMDLFGHQLPFVQYIPYEPERHTKMPLGHFIVVFRKRVESLGDVDWDRKAIPIFVPAVSLPGFD